jgi:hypothetical protein
MPSWCVICTGVSTNTYSADKDLFTQAHLCSNPHVIHNTRGAMWFLADNAHMLKALVRLVKTTLDSTRGNFKQLVRRSFLTPSHSH